MIRLTLRSAWYLLAYQLLGWLLFSAVLTAVCAAATLAVTLVGIPLLMAAGLVVITLWLCCIAAITVPLWYRFPVSHFAHGLTVHGVQLGYFPNGPHGSGAVGWYVQTLPQALLVAALAVAGLVLSSYLVVVTARTHSSIAKVLLRAPRDPLAEAKKILNRPLIHN